MPKITGSLELLSPKRANGTDNPFFVDVMIALAKGRPVKVADDNSVELTEVAADDDRLTVEKAISLYDDSGGAARVTNFDCHLGIPASDWNKDCPFVSGKKWSELADEGTSFTSERIGSRHWVLMSVISTSGLDSKQLKDLVAAGVEVRTNKQYKEIQPRPNPIDVGPNRNPT